MPPSKPTCLHCGSQLQDDLCPTCTLKLLGTLEGSSSPSQGTGPEITGLTVHEEIGEGGFGVVYRATQTGLVQRRVALKVLKPGIDTRAVLKRFSLERQTLASLEHPYIARFYQAGETAKGYPWFTMEYILGEPITDALATSSPEFALSIFLKVCDAVSFAHEKGIFHRDLKPTNILVTPDGTPKIIDFGVAKATLTDPIPGTTLYTADEEKIGTPGYSPPEQGDALDARSDVFSLGATLFELLTGITPPESLPIPKASKLSLKELTSDFDHVLQKAMSAKPEDRYQTVKEFSLDLDNILSGNKTTARPGLLTKKTILVAAAIAVSSVGAYLIQTNTSSAPLEPTTSGSPKAIRHLVTGSPNVISFNKDRTRGLATFRDNGPIVLFDPHDGREIFTFLALPQGIGSSAFNETGDKFTIGYSNGTIRWYHSDEGQVAGPYYDCTPEQHAWVPDIVHVTLPGQTEPSTLVATPDSKVRSWTSEGELEWEVPLVSPPYALRVNPEKTFALSGSRSGRINMIDLTQKTRRTLEGHTAHILGIEWSPDGSLFACASYDSRSSIWDKNGTLIKMLPHDSNCQTVSFSNDGSMLATASWDGTARLWEIPGGKELRKFQHKRDILTVSFSPDGQILATGGKNNTISFWNTRTGKAVGTPISTDAAVKELEFFQRRDGGLNIIATTWEPALHIIPVEFNE